MRFESPAKYVDISMTNTDEKSVSAFWNSLAEAGKDGLIANFRHHIDALHLNDWGVYEFAKSVASQLFPDNYNEQAVAVVFVVNQLGYKAKVGRVGKQLLCLLPVRNTIYGVSFLRQGNVNYYVYSPSDLPVPTGSLYTYALDFPEAQAIFDMHIYEPLDFESTTGEYTFTTKWRGKDIEVKINKGILEFYDSYPQVDVEVYADAAPSNEWAAQIRRTLAPMLEDRDDYGATAALLNFMHKSFPYATDEDQFGHEKYLFCEESFYYKGSDCEDHAILFSYLVRTLVGRDVILLDYPDHIAAAVNFSDPSVAGDYYMYNGKKYVVCDPTYFGASIGESMPQYKNVGAKLIGLRK